MNRAESTMHQGVLLLTKRIVYSGREQIAACDAKCHKAWGIQERPKLSLSDNPDDVVYLSDGELPEAPANPGTFEGGYGKPLDESERLNRWCVRQCERSDFAPTLAEVKLRDHSVRRYNMPRSDPLRAADAKP